MAKILSIIIPTYNAEQFLDKGLTSYIMPDKAYMDMLEVLVINDGTPDGSVAVAQKYVDQYPDTFRIVHKENGGHGSAINKGVEEATGKYFKIVDADDWVDTDVLMRTLDILSKEDFDAAVQSFRAYNITTKEFEYWDIPEDIAGTKTYDMSEIMQLWEVLDKVLTFHGLIYNTEFYRSQNYKLIEHVYYEDQEYSTIPLCWAKRVRLIADELYVYRVGDVNQSISEANLFKRLDHFQAVIFRMVEFDKRVDETPAGGYDYWKKKTTRFITDLYQLTLIRCQDKKKYRQFCNEVSKKLEGTSPRIYAAVKNKYLVFKVLNLLHMNEDTYRNKFSKLLEWAKKVCRRY